MNKEHRTSNSYSCGLKTKKRKKGWNDYSVAVHCWASIINGSSSIMKYGSNSLIITQNSAWKKLSKKYQLRLVLINLLKKLLLGWREFNKKLKKIYVCHEIRTEQREAQFVQMINEAGLCSREERVITYSPWSASGDAPPSGFMFHGFGERASELSRISCEGLCLTVQSSTELDGEKRDVVILQVSSAWCGHSTVYGWFQIDLLIL